MEILVDLVGHPRWDWCVSLVFSLDKPSFVVKLGHYPAFRPLDFSGDLCLIIVLVNKPFDVINERLCLTKAIHPASLAKSLFAAFCLLLALASAVSAQTGSSIPVVTIQATDPVAITYQPGNPSPFTPLGKLGVFT